MKLKLLSGTTGFTNEAGQWIATGSQMGRRDITPSDKAAPIKLHMARVPFVGGCYDKWGAYWGGPANLYCAWKETWSCVSIMLNFDACVFVRASNRHEAKRKVRQELPNARFYR